VMVLLIAHGLIMRDAYPNHGSACATVTGTNVLFDGVTRYQEKDGRGFDGRLVFFLGSTVLEKQHVAMLNGLPSCGVLLGPH